MKRVRDLVNESGAGLWGTDKARERLQKDTPGQEIKSLVKKSQKVSEAADPKGTIKVVKQDKVRYITKDELNTYRQMGWKQVEKRPQGDDKIRAAKKAHAAGTWDGNVNKDGKPIVHIDGKPVVVEGYDRAAISAALKKAAEKDNMKSKRDVERFFDYSGGDIIFKMVKDEDEANSLISQFKSQYKQKFKEDVDADRRDKLKMVNKNGTVVYATRDKVKHYMDLGYKSAAAVDARKKTLSRTNQNPEKAYSDVQRIAKELQRKKDDQKSKIQLARSYAKPGSSFHSKYRGAGVGEALEESVQLNELKVSFKFDKLADAARAERKAMQMKKLKVDSEKVQGKMMWLLHVSGKYTDIMKYIKRVDLEDKVHESKEMSLDDIKKRYAKEIIAFQDGGKDLSSGAKMALYGYIGSDGLKTDDADEFDDFVMGLQMGKYKKESLDEGSETWEAGYKRRVVRTTKPEHKEKGYNWRIKGKDKAHLTIKLYKDKPSQEEFNKQMKRVAGHEFGG